MRILHVSYHSGCIDSINYIIKKTGHQLETQRANWNYNISQDLADAIWTENKDYYNSFDCVITSDTSPLSRIFLRDEFQKKLIIWVCNRFDYTDQASNNCGFPDPDFYELFRKASLLPNVHIRSYTKFEHEYANKYRNVNWNAEVFRPCNEIKTFSDSDFFPDGQKKSDVFLITRYHNDNYLLDLKSECDSRGIHSFKGEYKGPGDLYGIRGIIHIPYAWSNLALFENWSIGNVYLIPSKNFLLELSKDRNFFWSPPFDRDFIHSSEWYLPEHEDLFIYFDSFDHLKQLSENENLIREKRNKVVEFSKKHNQICILQWGKILNVE
jgi:hypothetical protein